MRYIGSKARVVDDIMAVVGPPKRGTGVFVDGFTGTGAVAAAAATAGWPVRINDHLRCATLMASARVTPASEVPFTALGGYEETLRLLARVRPRRGFIWREYSPASRHRACVERRYFTERNAGKIDGVRSQITKWATSGEVSHAEERILIADLLAASNRVANIAGTYGCFLREFGANAHAPLSLVPRVFSPKKVSVEALCGDVYDVPAGPADVVYYDPPYTKRQYAAYYHILETIAVGDSPRVEGITGLRPWQDRASIFCYKTKALAALVELVAATDAHRVLLSYSDQGHVSLDALRPNLERLGAVRVHELGKIGRYRPNAAASQAGSSVHEYLVEIDKSEVCVAEELDGACPAPNETPREREVFAK